MKLISQISSFSIPHLKEIREIESSSHYESYDDGFQHWEAGYPFALIIIIISGIAPFLFFKKKGWL